MRVLAGSASSQKDIIAIIFERKSHTLEIHWNDRPVAAIVNRRISTFVAMAGLMGSPLLLMLVLFVLKSQCQLIPNDFSCTRDMPDRSGIYSRPPNSNLIKVDLIHVFCGQIASYGASGFHARPGNIDPPSASTVNAKLKRRPRNQYDFAIFYKPEIYDLSNNEYVTKSSISSIWPTVLSMENIAWIITFLVDTCRPAPNKHLCVSDFSLLPGDPNAEIFDVRIIIIQTTEVGKVALTAYPTKKGSCNRASSSFERCNFRGFPSKSVVYSQ